MAPYNQELAAIKEWLSKEEYLPQNFDDEVLRKFIHSCYGSLEQTKRCIEKYCVGKYSMPTIFTNRDPLPEKMQIAFSITTVAAIMAGKKEFIFHELNDPELKKFNFYDIVKVFTVFAEHWILTSKQYAESHVFFLDLKHIFLKIIPKSDLFIFKQFIIYLLEAMPIRLKEVHLYNCPSYYEMLYGIVKPIIPQEIQDNIHFHFTMESLHNAVGKQYLPTELGGDGHSMIEDNRRRVIEIETSYRSTFQDDKFWKADLMQKPQSNGTVEVMSGSFKTLNID